MKNPEDQHPTPKKPRLVTRKGISVSEDALVVARPLRAETPLALVVEPREEGLDLERWAAANRELLNRVLAGWSRQK